MNKKIIAFDVGSKTIGVAKNIGSIALPVTTIRFEEDNFKQAVHKLIETINFSTFDQLIIGYPKNMDGTMGHRCEMVENFITCFQARENIAIERVDERLTTKISKNILAKNLKNKKRKKALKDEIAAQLILETYLSGY